MGIAQYCIGVQRPTEMVRVPWGGWACLSLWIKYTCQAARTEVFQELSSQGMKQQSSVGNKT